VRQKHEKWILLRPVLAIVGVFVLLFAYVYKEHELTKLRLSVPRQERDLKLLVQERDELCFQVNCFENPISLLQFLQMPQFSHLRFPEEKEILFIDE